MKVKLPTGEAGVGSGPRGKIRGFSESSRRRFFDQVHSIDADLLGRLFAIFVTLTYPSQFPGPGEAKRHLQAVIKRFERAWGPHGGWWKLEPQERGAPHFHLVLLIRSRETLGQMLQWWAENWYDIAGGGDELHLKFHLGQLGRGNRPCVEHVTSVDQLNRYLGKYIGKVVNAVDGWDWPGRFWGVIRRDLVKNLCRMVELDAPHKLGVMVKRAAVKYIEHQPSGRVMLRQGSTVVRKWMSSADRSFWAGVVARGNVPGLVMKVYHRRRRRRSSGGVTAYLPSKDGVRLVVHCCHQLGLAIPNFLLDEANRLL